MNKAERLAALERLARNRAVKGWAFKDLPAEEVTAIREFINGGKCPAGYESLYALARRQLKLSQ